MGRARPEVEAKWRARLEAWDASGLGAREFAAREDLQVGSLWAWKRRLRPEPTPKMVPVVVRAAGSVNGRRGGMLELVVNERYAVRVPIDFDESSLRRLLAALEP